MNILFLVFHGLSDVSGISKKIVAQVKGLQQCGNEVHLCTYDFDERGHRCRFVDGQVICDFGKGILAGLRKRMSYGAVFRYCREHDIQFVYARSFHNANPWTINLFHRLQKAGVKSVLEIPTYPYDSEYEKFGMEQKIALRIDQLFRKQLAAQMNGIVTFSDADTIFGQRTIKISNGVDFDAIPLRQPIPHPADEFHLLGVAEVHVWHAYDRMIKGVAEYYEANPNPELKVFFHIVGGVWEGDMVPWMAYIKEHHIEPYIIFHGQQSGDALTDAFNHADFAMGSLGRHRSGITKIKTLKNREYAARGIPFIYSEIDEDFEGMPYIMKAPADESPINVNAIIAFWRQCKMKPEEIRNSVIHLSWKEQMVKVMENVLK